MKFRKDTKVGYGIKIFPKAEHGRTNVADNALYLLPGRVGGGVNTHGYKTIEQAKAGLQEYAKRNSITYIYNIGRICIIKITVKIEEELQEEIS